jgi:tripartite-type tricarboxylate transporter receptor subunit TctC
LRILAVTSAERLDTLPDVPSLGEFVPGYEASSFYGIAAPARTPPEIIATLNRAINAGLTDPKLRARLIQLGGSPLVASPAEFGKLLAAETEKWGKVVKFAGIKAQ